MWNNRGNKKRKIFSKWIRNWWSCRNIHQALVLFQYPLFVQNNSVFTLKVLGLLKINSNLFVKIWPINRLNVSLWFVRSSSGSFGLFSVSKEAKVNKLQVWKPPYDCWKQKPSLGGLLKIQSARHQRKKESLNIQTTICWV